MLIRCKPQAPQLGNWASSIYIGRHRIVRSTHTMVIHEIRVKATEDVQVFACRKGRDLLRSGLSKPKSWASRPCEPFHACAVLSHLALEPQSPSARNLRVLTAFTAHVAPLTITNHGVCKFSGHKTTVMTVLVDLAHQKRYKFARLVCWCWDIRKGFRAFKAVMADRLL